MDDPGLSPKGHEQAREAAARLADFGKLSVISSPMRRTLETAAPYAVEVGREPAIDTRVSEVATPAGVRDRRRWLQQNFPWRGGPPRLWASLSSELRAWRRQVLDHVLNATEDSAVFTHFIAINVIAGAAMSRPETIVCRPDYASITEIDVVGGELRLVRAGAEMTSGEVR
jgi:broad specificity phosphatase PhoE